MNKKKSMPLFNGISGPDDQLQRQWLNFTSPAASTASKFHSFLHTNLNVLLVNHRSILRRLSTLQQFTHLFFSSLFTHIRKNELAARLPNHTAVMAGETGSVQFLHTRVDPLGNHGFLSTDNYAHNPISRD